MPAPPPHCLLQNRREKSCTEGMLYPAACARSKQRARLGNTEETDEDVDERGEGECRISNRCGHRCPRGTRNTSHVGLLLSAFG